MTSAKKTLLGILTISPIFFLIWYGISIFTLFTNLDAPGANMEHEMPSIMIRMVLPMIFLGITALTCLVIYLVDIFSWNPNFKGDKSTNQIVWTLVVLLAGTIGMIVYFIIEIYPRKIQADNIADHLIE